MFAAVNIEGRRRHPSGATDTRMSRTAGWGALGMFPRGSGTGVRGATSVGVRGATSVGVRGATSGRLEERGRVMREERLARAFVEFSDTLVGDYDVMEFLARVCERCVEVLEVSAVGALLTGGGGRLGLGSGSTQAGH